MNESFLLESGNKARFLDAICCTLFLEVEDKTLRRKVSRFSHSRCNQFFFFFHLREPHRDFYYVQQVLLSKATPEIVNETNYMYNTPLHMAAAVPNTVGLERQKEICRLLIQAGGQTNIQNRQGKTPLALVSSDRKEAIRKIFHKKA